MREIASSLAAVPPIAAALYPTEQHCYGRASSSNATATKPSAYAAPRSISATPRTGYTGRYTQADPMGLAAGTNLFGYAVSNPLGYIDPTGLEALPIPAQPPGEICPFPTPTQKAPNPSFGWKGGVIAVLIDFLFDPGIADAPTLEKMQDKLKKQCGKCKEQPNCPPCDPPVGTLGYRWDKVPPSKPHWPWKGDHIKYYFRSQSPAPVCKCFWSDTDVVLPPPPSPIAVPVPNSPVWP